jgi:hypothetical protein
MWWVALALQGALAAPCDLASPDDAPLGQSAFENTDRVGVLVELWIESDNLEWVTDILAVLDARTLPGVLVVPMPESAPSPALLALLQSAVERGHEVAVAFAPDQVPRDALASNKNQKQRLRWFRRAGVPVKIAASPVPGRVSEALLGRLGFKTILLLRGPASGLPRLAAVFEGQPRINVILHAGPYAGDCGISPDVAQFTPLASDRITQAIAGAARSEGSPTVRVALREPTDSRANATVLGRWLDEVALPASIRITSANQARLSALQNIRTGKAPPVGDDAGGGRLVSVEELRAAAASLADQNILPRTLPGDLNLTEAYCGFLRLLAGQVEGNVVRLGSLRGPSDANENRVNGVVEVDAIRLVALAQTLAAELPEEIPAALRVGDTLLGAAELLTAMASAIRGDSPPKTWPTASPDPNDRGLGWGDATLP